MPLLNKATKALKKQRKGPKEPAHDEDSDNDVTQEPTEAEVNKTAATGEAVVQINEPAQWVERMALTAVKSLPADLAPDDDPKREEVFIQHTMLSVVKGLSMLDQANIPWRRPNDYYAEMFKDDVHMNKIRESILSSKAQVEERAHRRAMKDQKKFGKEVQAEVLRQRAKYKRDLNDRVSDWKRKRRGNEETLDDVLEEEGDERGGKRPRRDGARGGPRQSRPKNLKPGGGGGGGGGKRPGKNARRRK